MRKLDFELQRFAYISNSTDNTIISGTAGNDSIYNVGDYVTINGGAGADSISNYGDRVTINGDNGNDAISNSGGRVLINSGAGDDSISIYYYDLGTKVYTGDGDDRIHIHNQGYDDNRIEVDAGNGNDFIYSESKGDDYTLRGGDGNDTIVAKEGSCCYLDGGAGADVISLSSDVGGGPYTITGGTGNDTIYLSTGVINNHIIQYVGGHDVVNYLSNENTLQVVSDSITSASLNGNDVVLRTGGGSITLKDYAEQYFVLRVGTTSPKDISVGSEGVDGIQNFGVRDSLYGTSGNDVISNQADDVVIYAGNGNDSIYNEGAYTIIEGGEGNDIINLSSSEENVVFGGEGDDTIVAGRCYSTSINGGAGNDSIFSDYTTGSTIDGGDCDDTIVAMNCDRASINGGAGNDQMTVHLDFYSNTVLGSSGNDYIKLSRHFGDYDCLIQYAEGDGNDTIEGITAVDSIQIAGSYWKQISGDDIILRVGSGSLTFKNAADTQLNIESVEAASYAEDTQPASLTVSGGVLSIGSTFDGDSIRASDYDVAKVDATALSRGIKIWGGNAADCILGGSGNDTIHGSNGADTLFGNAGNDCLSGGNGNDVLYGGEGADKMLGGNGNDTLYGGAGNDTLTGGNGNDTFVYESGSDLITDYRAGYDKIKIASGSITGSSLSGSNVILTTSGGSLTVKNGRGKNLTVIDASGRETTRKYSNGGSSAMLFSDDNFISGETNLDAVTEKNYSVVQIRATNFANLAQDETYITSAETNFGDYSATDRQ